MFNKFFIKLITLILVIINASLIKASELPKQSLTPGGVCLLHFTTHDELPPTIIFQNNKVLTMPLSKSLDKQQWVAIIGIPLTSSIGIYKIIIDTPSCKQVKTCNIKAKNYPKEYLTIQDNNYVQPEAGLQARLTREAKEIQAIYQQWTDKKITSLSLKSPVCGRHSNNFGLQRILNGIQKSPHSGLDIKAPKGTKVRAAKEGSVIATGNYFYTGNTVFIDHGQGFISSYAHLDTITVQRGQQVTINDVIGTVGNTGRATGPHLHWSVSLNGVRIDPALFSK